MRIIAIILGVFMLGPMIAGAGLQSIAGYMMFNTARNVSAAVNPAPYRGTLDMTNHINSRKQAEKGYLAMLEPDEMRELRKITLTTDLPVNDFLEPGEALPDMSFRDVFLKARATRMASRECAILNRVLTRDCEVISTGIRLNDSGTTVTLTANYDFVQAPALGRYDPDIPLRYENVKQQLDEPISGSAPDTRERLYRHIAELCNSLRRSSGNCGLSRVTLKQTNALRGRASFGVIQPRGE